MKDCFKIVKTEPGEQLLSSRSCNSETAIKFMLPCKLKICESNQKVNKMSNLSSAAQMMGIGMGSKGSGGYKSNNQELYSKLAPEHFKEK